MSFIPKFELYDYANTTKIYTFPAVFYTNAPKSSKKYTEVEGIRGDGSIIIEGSKKSWDLEIRGNLICNDYEELTSLMDTLESTPAENTHYYLRIDKTISTHYEYKIMRLNPIEYPESLRNGLQEYKITFRVLSW